MHCHHDLSIKVVQNFFFKSYPLIIPSFIAFALASRSGLRSFIGIQALPPPVAVDAAAKRHFSRVTKLSALACFIGLIGLEYFIISSDIETGTLERFLTYLIGFTTNTSLIMFFATSTRSTRWAIFRHSSGRAAFSPHSINWKIIPVVVASTALNLQTYVTGNRALTFITSTAIIYRFVAQPPRGVHSIRNVILGLTGMIFSLVLFTVLTGALMLKAKQGGEPEGEPMGIYPFSPQFHTYFQTFITSMISAAPGALIAVCYRFDYTQHQKRSDENQPLLAIESIPAPGDGLHYTTGVLIPLTAPRRFSRPFYATTLLSWLTSYVMVAIAFKTHPALRDLRHIDSAFDVVALLITLSIMILSLFIVAKARGELREMWTSKEAWQVPMVQKVVVDDGGESGDEVIPAYTDIVKDDTAPAYVEDLIKV